MKIGVYAVGFGAMAEPEAVATVAKIIDECGFHRSGHPSTVTCLLADAESSRREINAPAERVVVPAARI
jgi:hypothetical protein